MSAIRDALILKLVSGDSDFSSVMENAKCDFTYLRPILDTIAHCIDKSDKTKYTLKVFSSSGDSETPIDLSSEHNKKLISH